MRHLLLGLSLAVSLAASPAHGARISLPGGVFYYQPAASVFGSEAVWTNPAGLSRYNATEFQYMWDYYDGHFGKNWGSVFTWQGGMGLAYRKLDDVGGGDFREWVGGVGLPLGQSLHVGGSYRYITDGPVGFKKRHFWNIGVIEQNGGPFAWAAVFSNLNRGKLDGLRTETEMRYSVSVRPVKEKITLSVDMFLSTKTRLPSAEYIYHVEVIPRAGLYINGFVDSHRNFEVGLRANLLKYFTGSKSRYNRRPDHIGTTGFVGASTLKQPSLVGEPKRRLSLTLGGPVGENPPQPIWGRKPVPFLTLVTGICRAADDPSIREMVVTLDGLTMGFAQAQELREALRFFRSRNKFVTCYVANPGNLAYYVACSADRIVMAPVAQLNLTGLRAELTFYGGTLDKLGVRADLRQVGEYKTAAEVYTRNSASEANREQVNRLLDSMYDQFRAGMAEGRNISPDSAGIVIDHGPYTSAEALQYGLVDGLCYRDELTDTFLSRRAETSFRRYLIDTLACDGWPAKPVLAVVVAEGDITSEGPAPSLWGSQDQVKPAPLKTAFERAAGERRVAAMVFRIDSPGGLALVSDEIFHAAARAGSKKPLVVSMGSVAASGGYHIAMAGRHLLASPGTITGSIGVYGGKVDLGGLYDKIGLGKELYTRGRFAGMMSTIRPFTDDESEKYCSHLKAFYDYFVGLVAANRSLSFDSADALGRGRVWTGSEAMSRGLVDELGGIREALDFAAHQANISDFAVKIYPERRPWLILPGRPVWRAVFSVLSGQRDLAAAVMPEQGLADGAVFARMPYDITIE